MIEWVFALPEACNFPGVWLNKNDAFPIDDPFVVAHPELFSRVPAKSRCTDGRVLPEPTPLSEEVAVEAVPAGAVIRRARGRG
jgi:hypothetical protein